MLLFLAALVSGYRDFLGNMVGYWFGIKSGGYLFKRNGFSSKYIPNQKSSLIIRKQSHRFARFFLHRF
jgi:hypothetical protein